MLFRSKDIAALFEKQMEREIDGVTQIKSIEEEKLGKFDKIGRASCRERV